MNNLRREGSDAFLRGGPFCTAANRSLVLAASALTATAVFAECHAPEVVDTDANGTFSLVEVQAVYAAVTEEAFKAADADVSGELSADELKAAVEAGAFAM